MGTGAMVYGLTLLDYWASFVLNTNVRFFESLNYAIILGSNIFSDIFKRHAYVKPSNLGTPSIMF